MTGIALMQKGKKMAKLELEIDFKKLGEELAKHNFVEVVHCRDCKFYTVEERWCRRLGLCGAFGGEGFCSHGERRE